MEIGEEITIKAKIVDFDANPHGAAVKVEVIGYIDREERTRLEAIGSKCGDKFIKFWIHRLDQAKVII